MPFISRGMNNRTTIYGASVIFTIYNSWHEPPYDHIWSVSNLRPFTTSWHASNLSTIFVVLHTHLYGFHVLFPCTVVHEPPYQTYSSVWCAGFCRPFPRMNYRTDSTLVWGSLRLAPTMLITF